MDKKEAPIDLGFAKRLKEIMKERRLKQKDIAVLAGVSPAAVSGWMKGKVAVPEAGILKRLAKALSVSPFWLLYGEERRVTEGANKGVILVGSFSIDGETVQFSEACAPEFCAAANALRDCKSFIMAGSHMEPRISDGDIVIVDMNDKTIKNNAIYAFFVNGQFVVAALNRSISGHVSASYFNPPQTEQISGKITIIGRAVSHLSNL